MNNFDYVTHIQYHNWANEQLIATAEKIAHEHLMGGTLSQGTAFETMRHMLDVDWSWRLACINVVSTQVLWETEPLEDLPALKAYWRGEAQILLDYVRGLSDAALDMEVKPSWMEKRYQVKHILMHIVDHGVNHRSELGWYFTKHGFSVGEIGFLDYINSTR